MTPEQIQHIIDQTGKPLAYVEGFAYFYGRKFKVDQNVLIPRPETEDIINLAKPLKPTTILDVGTGSGCIAITLALELPDTKVTAVDISEPALKIARKNAQNHHQNFIKFQVESTNRACTNSSETPKLYLEKIEFQISDLCKNLQNQTFDLITANLPYVDPAWHWLDQTALSHEPQIALYAKNHGLALIKKLIQQAPDHLNPNGHLLLEADPSQHPAIIAYAAQHNLEHIETAGYILSFKAKTTPQNTKPKL